MTYEYGPSDMNAAQMPYTKFPIMEPPCEEYIDTFMGTSHAAWRNGLRKIPGWVSREGNTAQHDEIHAKAQRIVASYKAKKITPYQLERALSALFNKDTEASDLEKEALFLFEAAERPKTKLTTYNRPDVTDVDTKYIDTLAGEAKNIEEENIMSRCLDEEILTCNPLADTISSKNIAKLSKIKPGPDAYNQRLEHMKESLTDHQNWAFHYNEHNVLASELEYLRGLTSQKLK